MKVIDFKEGDVLEYELAPDPYTSVLSGLPRWHLDTDTWVDRGATNKFSKGIVKEDPIINRSNLVVFYPTSEAAYYVTFPCEGHPNYSPNQWWFPGFFTKIDCAKKLQCECGAEKVWGKTTPHSIWCPKYHSNH